MFKAELSLAKFSVSTQNTAEEITSLPLTPPNDLRNQEKQIEKEIDGVKREERKKKKSLHI